MSKKLWNPIFGGVMIGIAMILTFYTAGRGFGASGAFTRLAAWIQDFIFPSFTENSQYFGKYFLNGHHPLNNYLVFMAIGLMIGAFAASKIAGDFKFEVLRGPQVGNKARLIFALFGGIIVGFAARLARGCTSGQALVGGAELSIGSWVFMIFIFVGGFAAAYFVRREWL